jgi:outer membrane receptor for ferric coprogen and ferric-rhodotorulic acid
MTVKFTCPRQPTRGIALALLATTSLSIGVLSAVPVYAQQALSYDIAAGPLPTVLNQFARQAHVELIYDAPLTQSVTSPGLKGSFGAAEGLSRILAGTGLSYRQTGPNVFTLERAATSDASTVQLGPVRVEGGTDLYSSAGAMPRSAAVTEGTKSYTTNAVTIGKTILSPRDIPQSVSVVTRQRIEDQNLFTLPDALAQTPGLTVLDNGSQRNTFTARGFPIDSIQLDGVPTALQYNIVLSPDLAIYDRVEVIRGANGLLQGSGDPSASINLVRKRPTDKLAIAGAVSAGSWNNYRAEADVGGPLNSSGTIRARIVGSYQDNDYFYDIAHSRKKVVYGVVDFKLTPDTMVTAGYTYVGSHALPTLSGLPTYTDGGDLRLPRSTYPGAAWNRENFENHDAFVEVRQDFGGGWTGQAVFRHANASSDSKYGYLRGAVDGATGAGVTLAAAHILDYGDRQNGIDAFVSGPIRLFGRSHQLLIGGNAREDKYNFLHGEFQPGVVGTPIDVFTFDPRTIPEPVDSGTALLDFRARVRQAGIYGTARLNLSDPLTMILGSRVSWWTYESEFAPGALIVIPKSSTTNNGVFTPYAGLIYKIRPTVSLYASYADVFQPQSGVLEFPGKPLPPIRGTNYEAGIKAGFFGERLNTSFAIFQIDQTNRALSDPDRPCVGAAICYRVPAGKVRARGFEVEATGNITPNLEIAAGYTYTDTEFMKDRDATGAPTANEGLSFSPFTPKHLFKIWANYTLPGDLHRLSVGGGIQAQSSTSFRYNTRIISNGGYALVNLRAAYALADGVTLSANLNNLFDKRYYQTLANPNGSNPYEFYGMPRNFTITLRGKF